MLNIFNKNINLISFVFYFLIFTYVYVFSLNNIINLWTFNELHINYSTGFIPRGFIGTIMVNSLYTQKMPHRSNQSKAFWMWTCRIISFGILLRKKIQVSEILSMKIFLEEELLWISKKKNSLYTVPEN